MAKLYQIFEGVTRGLDGDGRGIIEIPGSRPIHANFTAPEDQVEVESLRRIKGKIYGQIVNLIKPGNERVVPRCPYAQTCGGCVWQFMDYEAQKKHKLELLNQPLEASHFTERIDTIIGAEDIYYFRNRMDYVFGPDGELGLKEPGSWCNYVDLKECHLLSAESSELLNVIRDLVKEFKLEPYEARKQTGALRYAVIREGKRSKERLLTLVTTSKQPIPDEFFEGLKKYTTTIYHGINDSLTDLSRGDQMILKHGQPLLREIINGITYYIPPQSFFQTNTAMAEKLQNTVLSKILPQESVLDLYCGVGFFSLALAKRGQKVKAIEIDAESIKCASQSATEQNLKVDFVASPAEDLSWAKESFDTLILDPPRAGLHPKVLSAVLEMAPKKIVYISCKFSRFVSELPSLSQNYTIQGMVALDLFPHTPHAEVVTVLVKKGA